LVILCNAYVSISTYNSSHLMYLLKFIHQVSTQISPTQQYFILGGFDVPVKVIYYNLFVTICCFACFVSSVVQIIYRIDWILNAY
jgi:hypothetical protein